MLAVGFLVGLWVTRKLTKKGGLSDEHITNVVLYGLISGIIGARIFYVVHYPDQFDSFWEIFAVWKGGLELLGGVLLAALVILMYLRHHKLTVRRYLDVLAIGLMVGLSFGRIGCFLNGCCFGQPSEAFCAVEFPYGSLVYKSQIYADPERNRQEPYLNLPDDFFGYYNEQGNWIPELKPFDKLSEKQKAQVKEGEYQALPVHPTQLYSSLNAALIAFILYLLWRCSLKRGNWVRPGYIFAAMFVLYGVGRFTIEFFRGDNPYEFDGITISQNIALLMIVAGVVFGIMFTKIKKDKIEG
jgi:phosphatidylglycerol:prolipoprotein diacylglycerol transferase